MQSKNKIAKPIYSRLKHVRPFVQLGHNENRLLLQSKSELKVPDDTPDLRKVLSDCVPSLVIDSVAKASGQRVVYFGHFDDSLIPEDHPPESTYLRGWHSWGPIVAKVVSGIDTQQLTYMQRETEILAEIHSPHFPKQYFSEVFTENPITEVKLHDRLYLTVEEHVVSQPLSNATHLYTNENQVKELLIKLCIAMNFLWNHPKRLVHRDLKPDNILIKQDQNVAIIDLGIVRETGAVGPTQSHVGGPLSPAYSAPELVDYDKNTISFKTDFFALGIIAHELLTGRNPFCPSPTTPVWEVFEAIRRLTAPTLESMGKAGPGLSRVIAQMLEKDAYRRPRTPEKLLELLRSA